MAVLCLMREHPPLPSPTCGSQASPQNRGGELQTSAPRLEAGKSKSVLLPAHTPAAAPWLLLPGSLEVLPGRVTKSQAKGPPVLGQFGTAGGALGGGKSCL